MRSPSTPLFLALFLALSACGRSDHARHGADAGAEASAEAAAPAKVAKRIIPKDHSFDVPNLRGEGAQVSTIGLQAILDGYGIGVSDAQIARESKRGRAGASIDALEQVATKHGLKVEQIILPVDAILLPEAAALPCLIVANDANGQRQFYVAWRVDEDGVQILDPARGRSIVTPRAFEESLHVYEVTVPAKGWTDYADSNEMKAVLRARMTRLGVPRVLALDMLAESGRVTNGRAALDAAIRATETELRTGDGNPSLRLRAYFECTANHVCDGVTAPSDEGWSARPAEPDDEGDPQVILRGAVLLRVTGKT